MYHKKSTLLKRNKMKPEELELIKNLSEEIVHHKDREIQTYKGRARSIMGPFLDLSMASHFCFTVGRMGICGQ